MRCVEHKYTRERKMEKVKPAKIKTVRKKPVRFVL